MTDRLDQIEGILQQTVSIQQSNSRAIAALSNQVTEMGQRLEASLESFSVTVNEALAAQDQRQIETSRQIQSLVDNQQGTNQQIQILVDNQQETSRQIQVLVDEGRANAAEHEAFREQFQQLLGQIVTALNSIWQRLAG